MKNKLALISLMLIGTGCSSMGVQPWEREILAREDMSDAVLQMWRSSMELSPDYGRELREFWKLPEDFTF